MDERKLRGLMGLCVRAGQAVFGEDGCVKTLRSGECGALLLDGGVSPAALEKYRKLCERQGAVLLLLPEDLLEEATGRPGRAMAVRKGSFAEQMVRCAQTGGK